MPLVSTKGAASAQGFGEFSQASGPVNYIEDVFSCFIYTGTGAALTITNNIDLSTKGGLVWIKGRSGATDHKLTDTARGVTKALVSNSTAAQTTDTTGLTAFGTTGFTLGANTDYNTSAATYVSWTFREQAKFFDVVTYTGTGANTTISHNLGSVPGCIIVKRTDTTADWAVYHRSLANTQYLVLNTTAAAATGATWWNSTTPTSSVFSLGTDASVNASGGTYVAYIYAHDAGGFGLTGADNVISCGSFTTTADAAAEATVTLGYEPQFVLLKSYSGGISNWYIFDTMRGWTMSTGDATLFADTAAAETTATQFGNPTATGFYVRALGANQTYLYVAIRRGPMEVPTVGTSVYNAIARTGTAAVATVTGVGFAPDLVHVKDRTNAGPQNVFFDRLRGVNNFLENGTTAAEVTLYSDTITSYNMDGISLGADGSGNVNTASGSPSYINHFFLRAPGFFDEVCYAGTGANTTQAHNLGVVPELIIVKRRDTTGDWDSYCSALANTEYVVLNTTAAKATGATRWNSTTPTASVFSIGTSTTTNAASGTYVAYLFATCAGVSKVGSYTGTAATLQINCGFTAGSRFVLIKRTDSTGDWYYWDSTRGIVAGNDPYLLLNSTAAEVTSTDYVDTYNAGFELTSTAPAGINASGGTYIFLAIA